MKKKKPSNKSSKKSLLEIAQELYPEAPYGSRSGWEQHPIEQTLDLAIAYCRHKIGATAFTKALTGQPKPKPTNVPYFVGMIFGKALREGWLKKVKRRSVR